MPLQKLSDHLMDKTIQPASPKMGKIARAVLLVCAAFLLFYAAYYYYTVWTYDKEAVARFISFKNDIFFYAPFLLIILLFFIGLWTYALFVDFNNLFRYFTYKPGNAMLQVTIPFLNIVGIGLAFSKVINSLDKAAAGEYIEGRADKLKFFLALLYGGICGVLLSYIFSITLSSRFEIFVNPKMVIFNTIQFALIIAIIVGFYRFIKLAVDIARYQYGQSGHA